MTDDGLSAERVTLDDDLADGQRPQAAITVTATATAVARRTRMRLVGQHG